MSTLDEYGQFALRAMQRSYLRLDPNRGDGLSLGIANATTNPVGSVLMAMLSGGFLTIAILESVIAWRTRSS